MNDALVFNAEAPASEQELKASFRGFVIGKNKVALMELDVEALMAEAFAEDQRDAALAIQRRSEPVFDFEEAVRQRSVE